MVEYNNKWQRMHWAYTAKGGRDQWRMAENALGQHGRAW